MMLQMFSAMSHLISQAGSGATTAFAVELEAEEEELPEDIIQPALLEEGLKQQQPLPIHPFFGRLFFNEDGTPLGGIPKGCTVLFTGPSSPKRVVFCKVCALSGGG